jgi:hypothetical protein
MAMMTRGLIIAGGAAALAVWLLRRGRRATTASLVPGCAVAIGDPPRARARGPKSIIIVGAGIVRKPNRVIIMTRQTMKALGGLTDSHRYIRWVRRWRPSCQRGAAA